MKAARNSGNPLVAAGRYFDAARMAGGKALAGDAEAVTLYNHAVARLVEILETEDNLPLGSSLEIGDGDTRRTLRITAEPGSLHKDTRIVVVDTLEFRGHYAGTQATREGLGAPVVAVSSAGDDYRSRFEASDS